LAASIHIGGDRVTLLTGSPIADGGIDVPAVAGVQSDAVIATSGPSGRRVDPAGDWASAGGAPSCQTIAVADTAPITRASQNVRRVFISPPSPRR
jgi:hypothetical protein